jgi:hypothetical protein
MKNDVFWDVTPRGSCKNRRFGGTSVSVLTRAKWCNIPEYAIPHSENLLSYIALIFGPEDGGRKFIRNVDCRSTESSTPKAVKDY